MSAGRMWFLLSAWLCLAAGAALADSPGQTAWSSLGGDYWKGTEPRASTAASGHAPVWGFADLHAHFFNYLAYGGRVFHGKTFSPKGIADALDDCGEDHGSLFGKSIAITPEPAHRTAGYPNFESWPRYDSLVHQQAYVDWIRRAWAGGLRVVQMDIQNTAFMGHAYSVINRLFVRGNMTPLPYDDVSAVRLQAAAARELFDAGGQASDFAAIARSPEEARAIVESGKLAVVLGVELEAIGNLQKPEQLGADPRGKIREVLSDLWAAGVRHVIPIHLTRNAFGHPAVFQRTLDAVNYATTGQWYDVIESFADGFRFDPRLAKRDPLTWFFEFLGDLRHTIAYPNIVAAAAARTGLTPDGEILIEELMRQGFLIDVEHMSQRAADRTLELAEREDVPVMASHGGPRDMSFGNRITYAADGGYSVKLPDVPLADDEKGVYGTSEPGKVANERAHPLETFTRIRKLGGMIGMGLGAGGIGVDWRGRVPLDCDSTSKSFLQEVFFANEVMGRDGATAIGSDVSGVNPLPAPRFGVEACPGGKGDEVRRRGGRIRAQALAQENGVAYSTPVSSVGPWRFERSGSNEDNAYSKAEARAWLNAARATAQGGKPAQTNEAERLVASRWSAMTEGPNAPLERSRSGNREWDVNIDGVAHYGLLPDFFQDAANVLRANGQGDELAPLFRSADYYLRMWEKIDSRAAAIRSRDIL